MQISPSTGLGTTQICDLIVPCDCAPPVLTGWFQIPLLLLLFAYSQQPSHVVPLSFPSKRTRAHARPC